VAVQSDHHVGQRWGVESLHAIAIHERQGDRPAEQDIHLDGNKQLNEPRARYIW
jgi:hypothetical protein